MTETIDLSPGGFRFPYHRFLADIAAGLFTVIVLATIYYLDLPLPELLEAARQGIVDAAIGPEVKIFLMIILALAAVPVGLVLNGVGFLFLGGAQSWGVQFYSKLGRWPASATNRAFRRDLIIIFFALEDAHGELYRRAKLFEGILEARLPLALDEYRHVAGLKTLMRSLALLGLLCFLIFGFFRCDFCVSIVTLGVSSFFLLLVGLLEYYLCLAILFRVMMLVIGKRDDGRRRSGLQPLGKAEWDAVGEPLEALIAVIAATSTRPA